MIANPAPVTRAPSARTFASLCSLVASAEKQSPHKAARIPLNRFAAIEIPIPVPQINIPLSHTPAKMALHTNFAYFG